MLRTRYPRHRWLRLASALLAVAVLLGALPGASLAAGPATLARMRRAYTTATRCEWMFWDAAHRRETWPV